MGKPWPSQDHMLSLPNDKQRKFTHTNKMKFNFVRVRGSQANPIMEQNIWTFRRLSNYVMIFYMDTR